MKPQPALTADDLTVERTIDDQVRRLRRMLVLMAPETGSSALGAECEGFADFPLDDRPPALTDRHH